MVDDNIWSYPEHSKVNATSLTTFEESFPDPNYYCIGVYHPKKSEQRGFIRL
jgi:hypothetical protein